MSPTDHAYPDVTVPRANLAAMAKTSPPAAILAVMMFLLPAAGVPSEMMLQDTFKSAIAAFGVLAATFAFFMQTRTRTEPLVWHPMLWLPLGLVLYALGSMVWSDAYLAGVEAIRWALISLLIWLGLNTVDRHNLPRLLWGIHLGTVVASMWVALQFWLDFSWFPQAVSPASTFINRNFFAEYAVSALPFSVYTLSNSRPSRWLGAVSMSLALVVIAIMMTGTRSALLAMMVLTPLMLFALIRYRSTLGFASWTKGQCIAVGGIFLLGVVVMGHVPSGNSLVGAGQTPWDIFSKRSASTATILGGTDASFSTRVELWKASARLIMAHPLLGVGAGAWEVAIPLYQRIETGEEIDAYAHNEYLQLLGEFGLPVGGLILAIFFAALIKCTSHILYRKVDTDAPAAFAAISIGALLLVASVGFPMHLAAGCTLLSISLVVVAQTSSSATEIHFAAKTRRACLLGIGVSIVISFCAFATAAWAERLYVLTGKELALALLNPMAGSEKATSAKERLAKAIALHPRYAKLQKPIAAELVELGEWDAALAVVEALTISRPNAPDHWFSLAVLRAKLGDLKGSEFALERLESLQPYAVRNVLVRIDLLNRMGLHTQAQIEARKLTGQSGF